MKNKKNNKKRNPVAKELYTPKYKPRVIPDKKKDYDDYNLLIEDVDDNLFGQSDEQIVSEINKKGNIK